MLSAITLILARNPGQLSDDVSRAYELRAPLNASGAFDRKAWSKNRQLCTVRRFEGGREAESGLLVHVPGGWAFSYAPGDADDEKVFRLAEHRFRVGEYVSITEHDGVQRTYKVAAVMEWHPAQASASA